MLYTQPSYIEYKICQTLVSQLFVLSNYKNLTVIFTYHINIKYKLNFMPKMISPHKRSIYTLYLFSTNTSLKYLDDN